MHYELLFPGKYLRASDLKGMDVTLTMSRDKEVSREELRMQGGLKQKKPVLYFEETKESARRKGEDEKRLALNKTNAATIAGLYGNDTADWPGKRITLYPTRTQCGGKEVDCIRIRDKAPEEAS